MRKALESAHREMARANLDKANDAKRRMHKLRVALKEETIDPIGLLLGNLPAFEETAKRMKVIVLLPCIKGIGPKSAWDLLVDIDVPPDTMLGEVSWDHRQQIANLVRSMRQLYLR